MITEDTTVNRLCKAEDCEVEMEHGAPIYCEIHNEFNVNPPIKKEQLGPYKMTVEWLPMTDEETRDKALETLLSMAKEIDRNADFELACVQEVKFVRV